MARGDGWLRGGAVALALCVMGCTTSLATLTPAQTTPAGKARIVAAAAASLPLGGVLRQLEASEARVRAIYSGSPATEADLELLTDTAIAVAITPPSVTSDVQVRWGIRERVDVGLRFAGGTIHGSTQVQFLGDRAKGDLVFGSFGFGAGVFVFGADLPVPSEYEQVLAIENNGQYQVDASLNFGLSGDAGHLWFGQKFALAGFDTDATITLLGLPTVDTPVTGSSVYYGLQLGGALRIFVVHLVLEITAAAVVSYAESKPLGTVREDSASGWVLYPAAGLMLEF